MPIKKKSSKNKKPHNKIVIFKKKKRSKIKSKKKKRGGRNLVKSPVRINKPSKSCPMKSTKEPRKKPNNKTIEEKRKNKLFNQIYTIIVDTYTDFFNSLITTEDGQISFDLNPFLVLEDRCRNNIVDDPLNADTYGAVLTLAHDELESLNGYLEDELEVFNTYGEVPFNEDLLNYIYYNLYDLRESLLCSHGGSMSKYKRRNINGGAVSCMAQAPNEYFSVLENIDSYLAGVFQDDEEQNRLTKKKKQRGTDIIMSAFHTDNRGFIYEQYLAHLCLYNKFTAGTSTELADASIFIKTLDTTGNPIQIPIEVKLSLGADYGQLGLTVIENNSGSGGWEWTFINNNPELAVFLESVIISLPGGQQITGVRNFLNTLTPDIVNQIKPAKDNLNAEGWCRTTSSGFNESPNKYKTNAKEALTKFQSLKIPISCDAIATHYNKKCINLIQIGKDNIVNTTKFNEFKSLVGDPVEQSRLFFSSGPGKGADCLLNTNAKPIGLFRLSDTSIIGIDSGGNQRVLDETHLGFAPNTIPLLQDYVNCFLRIRIKTSASQNTCRFSTAILIEKKPNITPTSFSVDTLPGMYPNHIVGYVQ